MCPSIVHTEDSYLCEAAILVRQVYFENIFLALTPNPHCPLQR